MILVDTSVWVDHLKKGDVVLGQLLIDGEVLTHSWVIGELALGQWRGPDALFDDLDDLPRVVQALDDDILHFIRGNALFGTGIGYVDAGLLASTMLTPKATLWTRERRLSSAAGRLGLVAKLSHRVAARSCIAGASDRRS